MNWFRIKIHQQTLLVLTSAFFVGLINIFQVISGAFQIPKGYVYLAVGHYFFDYFLYIAQIVQGMRGHLLFFNPYNASDTAKTFIGFGQFLILGQLARIFHLSPFFAYWLAVFILSVVLSLLFFQLIKQLIPGESFFMQFGAWLLSIFAAPFIHISYTDNQLNIIPYNLWYDLGNIFQRFGVLPHHLMTSICVVLLLLLISKLISNLDELTPFRLFYETLIIAFLLVVLLTFAPFQVINIISASVIIGWIYLNLYLLKKNKNGIVKLLFFLGLIIFIVLPASLIFRYSIQSIDYFKQGSAWEKANQSYPSILDLLAVTGPILVFVPFGIKYFLKSASPIKLLLFFFTVFCYVYSFTPLAYYLGSHNLRFPSSVAYVLFGTLASLGMKNICCFFTKKWFLPAGLMGFFLIYFFATTLVIYCSLGPIDSTSYLPTKLINGIISLDRQRDRKAVLTSPMLPLGIIVPIFVDRKVYLGRSMFTPDYEYRTVVSDQFFRHQLSDERAKQLILDNNIGYVVLAGNEPYKTEDLEQYLFLKKIINHKEVKIYQVL